TNTGALRLLWDYGDVGLIGFLKRDDSVHEGENRIVFTESYVFAWVPFRSGLADDNAAGRYELPHGRLEPKALRIKFATVAGRYLFFLMCHLSVPLRCCDLRDFHSGVFLAMAYSTAIVFAPFVFESDHLWAFCIADDFCVDDAFRHMGNSHMGLRPVVEVD